MMSEEVTHLEGPIEVTKSPDFPYKALTSALATNSFDEARHLLATFYTTQPYLNDFYQDMNRGDTQQLWENGLFALWQAQAGMEPRSVLIGGAELHEHGKGWTLMPHLISEDPTLLGKLFPAINPDILLPENLESRPLVPGYSWYALTELPTEGEVSEQDAVAMMGKDRFPAILPAYVLANQASIELTSQPLDPDGSISVLFGSRNRNGEPIYAGYPDGKLQIFTPQEARSSGNKIKVRAMQTDDHPLPSGKILTPGVT